MSGQYRIALDAMGGDCGLSVVQASRTVCSGQQYPDITLILVGDEAQVQAALAQQTTAHQFADRLSIRHASQVVQMDEPPAIALKNKRFFHACCH